VVVKRSRDWKVERYEEKNRVALRAALEKAGE
jgi:hypothetical protein